MDQKSIDAKCVSTIKQFVPDVVQKAKSGHPGAPMGCALIAHTLFSRIMLFNPAVPSWPNRDRFVLSNGHACALLYTMLHLCGYPITMNDLKSFRQLGSKTPGHPERKYLSDGIDVSTGPLGQGIANAVGMALAAKNCAATYNKPNFELFNSYIYVLLGDGCMQEGVQYEAVSLAGHLKLGNLIAIYDDNNIQIDGETDLAFTEDVLRRFEAFGWHVQSLPANCTVDDICKCVQEAKNVKDKPSLIKIKTVIGDGSKNQGTEKVHGAPLGEDDIAQLKQRLGFDPSKFFYIHDDVYAYYKAQVQDKIDAYNKWSKLLEAYSKSHRSESQILSNAMLKVLPEALEAKLPKYTPDGSSMATRSLSQEVLNIIGPLVPYLIGGSADLTPSNLTKWKGSVDFQGPGSSLGSYSGRYLRFGVREHGMSAICNGISAFGLHIPFAATFLNFLGYAFGAIRLSALSGHQVIYIGTHDSIGLGEDGPTHQPIEILALMRATPNIATFRPADGNEVNASYIHALRNTTGPTVIALSRQAVPKALGSSSMENALKGAYTIHSCQETAPDVILVATGTEVHIAIETAKLLKQKSISANVVSMPCWELMDKQPQSYRDSVFIKNVPVVSIEALSTFGWSKWAHLHIGIDTFGESGKAEAVYKHFKITPQDCLSSVLKFIER